jgi:glycosyltransferase involved in cell wall biosynthesis
MRIAQVAPLIESVPPKFYGGTERVISFLTEELVRQGHDVTLFASADSRTSARLRPGCENALRLDPACVDAVPHHVLLVEKVHQEADSFDVIHFHDGLFHFSVFRRQATPFLTTLHGRLDLPDVMNLYREFRDLPFISISDAQRLPLPWLDWQQTIYHGLPLDLLQFDPGPGRYLAFLGRISHEKRPDRAIKIACEVGMELKIAAKVDRADQVYFDEVVRPLLDHPLVDFVGEITEAEKSQFLGQAWALLFPIDWPEPFGLTMIEAMACGTPVIAFRAGSVPEVIDHGMTGLVVDDLHQAISAVEDAGQLNRSRIRQTFERRFSASRMAEDYVAAYKGLLKSAHAPLRVA